ncbi:MAG: GNAT family acetyltransferase [Hyphomicrobiales bacterium]|nr:MAG: GNAT family acetyltransferase [Hyphomicrobiales bacterium]
MTTSRPADPAASATLTIAPATTDQRDAIVALWLSCGLMMPYNDGGADFDFAAAKPGSDVLAGTLDDTVVASVMVGHDGHRGWLYYVAVDDAWRGRGFGRQMIEAGEAWLEERCVVKAMLLVRPTNTAVISCYEHLGYETAPRTVLQKWLRPPEE